VKSDREWQHWGSTDPFWAVSSWEGKRRSDPTPWTAEELRALGESDFGDVLGHWSHYGLRTERCVEIGCGAGRMTYPLAACFRSVVALDVSRDQLMTARHLVGERIGRVLLCLVDRPVVPLGDGSCTAMFSTHVFQHFSNYDGIERYLMETFRVLASGGTVCFHTPVPGAHKSVERPAPWMAIRNLKVSVQRAIGLYSVMEFHRYQPSRILGTLERIGFRDRELRIFAMSSNGDLHSFFFARKP